jgi:hypothetical protein
LSDVCLLLKRGFKPGNFLINREGREEKAEKRKVSKF